MRVIVCGSRTWIDRERIARRLAELPVDAAVVVGYDPRTQQPRGADRIAWAEAHRLGLSVECHPADWAKHGRRAGVLRNEHMAAAGADLLLAFWDGCSPGTADMLRRAHRHGIPVGLVRVKPAPLA